MKSIFPPLKVPKGSSLQEIYTPRNSKTAKELVWDKPQLLNTQNEQVTFGMFINLI